MVAVATPRRTAQALGKWRPSLTPAGPQKIADSSGAKKQHQERAPRQQQDPTPCHKATACRDSAQDGCKGSLHPASRAADASFSELTTNHSGLGRELQKTAAQDSPKLQHHPSSRRCCRELGAFSQAGTLSNINSGVEPKRFQMWQKALGGHVENQSSGLLCFPRPVFQHREAHDDS